MRTHTAGLITHLAEYAHTRCTMLLLDLIDGTRVALTDHDEDLAFNLGDGAATYSSAVGILPSDIVLGVGLDVPNYEVTAPLSDLVTLAAIAGKRFNRARARLFQVNWADLTQGASKTLYGKVADSRVEGGAAVLEVRGLAEAYNQVVGEVMTLTCKADFGDARCTKARTDFDTEITAATSNFQFTVSVAGIPLIPFAYGSLQFTSGDLDGAQEVELFSFNQATGATELYAPLPDVPEVGADLTIFNGCSKLKTSGDAGLPTCLFYENVINFRGEDQAPGDDMYHKFTIPGAGGA